MFKLYHAVATTKEREAVQKESQALLDCVLRKHGADPRCIVRDENGKPRLPDGSLFFNLSHASELIYLAVSDAEIGVDCEEVRPIDFEKLARRFCSAGEQEIIFSSDDPRTAFFRVWTRKEAYVKMKGVGFTEGIRTVDTSSLPADRFSESTHMLGERVFLVTVYQQ